MTQLSKETRQRLEQSLPEVEQATQQLWVEKTKQEKALEESPQKKSVQAAVDRWYTAHTLAEAIKKALDHEHPDASSAS